MSRPAPQVPFERRRPIPPFGSADEIKRAVEYPHFLRGLVTVGGVMFALVFAWAMYALANRDRDLNTTITVVFAVALFTVAVIVPRVAFPLLMRRFYDRVMGGGILCDVYPAGFPDAKTAILIDARLSDAQAAYVHDATVSWLGRLASDPAAGSQAPGLFSDGPIRSADEFAGPGARGGFLVARDKNPNQGWRLLLPETSPRDPHRPYSNGLVVQVKTPSLESAGQ
ncbi:hypothetical protein VST63_04705 [Mycolicibacterium sp. 050232]|uniref:hypothetical protein n=1 Tax=Mycolicibacterium sp. 050232 TaxID=3113982 RepID=UPI002E2B787C|nr:hypothetical protein [Mycolicibacterium sp. 050232]MED5811651.1 hypothetical protein [Mycolicibacterium sp. 050232]